MNKHTKHACDICNSTESVEVPYARLYTNDQPIHICRQCGFVYVKYRRSAKAIAKAWSEEVFGDVYTARIPAVKARQVYVADFLDMAVGLANKTVVDIGAGEGQFLEIVRDWYGSEVFGIEPSKDNCATLQSNNSPHFLGTVEQFSQSDAQTRPDIVTIMWTLENCQSCIRMLKEAWNMLEVGGRLIVATGSRILVPFKKPMFDYLNERPLDLHPFRFSANALQAAMAQSGFKPIKVNRYQDTEYLTVVAQKCPEGEKIDWQGDDFIRVYDFFERWHRETLNYS